MSGAIELPGHALGLAWTLPFAGLLLSIALLPAAAPGLWHRHHGKIALFWAVLVLAPIAWVFGPAVALHEAAHALIVDYVPFVLLLGALYVISGGIGLEGRLAGTPGGNALILALGTLLASFMGTTGAAMLLIRPLLRANAWRRRRAHVFVFFILLVGNVGGALTPLGDPPLFVGFLNGVGFLWTMKAMALPMVLTAGLLLLAFYVVDRRLARGETPPREDGTLRIHGGINILWLLGVVLAVLMSGLWRPEFGFEVFGIRLGGQALLRDGLLILFAALSFATTPSGLRAANGFSWTPIEEVALLFFGIFITVVPALDILGAGRDGALGPLIAALAGPDGEPAPARYFWATGILSAFLDNAPTYLVFFKMAGGEAEALMRPPATVLTAISCGAVFMGALSYIGNAPNLMVKAICEAEGVRMPGFFAYLLWAALLLLPTQLLLSLVFFL